LKAQATEADSDDIQRNAIIAASERLQQTYGKRFDAQLFRENQQQTAHLLGEDERKQSLRAQLARSPIRSNERRVKNVDETQL